MKKFNKSTQEFFKGISQKTREDLKTLLHDMNDHEKKDILFEIVFTYYRDDLLDYDNIISVYNMGVDDDSFDPELELTPKQEKYILILASFVAEDIEQQSIILHFMFYRKIQKLFRKRLWERIKSQITKNNIEKVLNNMVETQEEFDEVIEIAKTLKLN